MPAQAYSSTQTAQAVIEGVHPRAEAMARAMIDNYQNCDAEALLRAGFSRQEIDAHHETASGIARTRFLRDDTSPDYDRAARIRQASHEILALCPDTPRIATHLTSRGFSAAELGDILDDALARAGNSFAGMGGGR